MNPGHLAAESSSLRYCLTESALVLLLNPLGDKPLPSSFHKGKYQLLDSCVLQLQTEEYSYGDI